MVVVAVTYAELIIEGFYYALFSAHPKRMNSYLAADGKGKATLDLNEIIDTESREKLIENLVKRAANRATKGELNEIVGRIVRDSKVQYDRHSFIDDLQSLEAHRNKIAHEVMFDEIKVEQVINYFGLIMYMLYVLAEAAILYQLTVVDDGNLIHEIRNRLQEVALS